MSETRKAAKLRIEELVHFFEQNIHQFKAPSFNETQARQQLIDPFFEALGWDITNRGMKPLYLQEVIPEGRVKTNIGKEVREQTVIFDAKESLGKKYKEYASILDYIAEDEYKASAKEATKKPDYRFRIKGQTKFFVEAKKPFVDLSRNQDAIFQVKRYGFSGRVPVSILTDFEEFRVFDCTHKPLYEKPTLGVIKELDLTYAQYRDEFDHLYDTFSREAVESGSLDTLTKKLLQKKTGDFALDKTFLDDLSKWREELARDIAKHPRNRRTLNDYTLNESVQRILDRIVFFRVCEDREIEVENTLLAVLQMWKSRPGVSLYSLLNQLFQQRRTLYNGLLFSPHECEELEVGDDVLLKILQNLNYPFSPYHFNEIGVEILGSIYEKFLGKTIHLAAKNVIISEKPEVRKAGGVYYTPQYIVNYIVDNTLGKLLYSTPSVPTKSEPLAGGDRERELLLSPKQVAKLKIIDIACGSGSFLLGAFRKLIDFHIEWYHQHPKDIQMVNNVPDAYKDVNGNLRLSSRKKRDILVNNIYGVDIDRQAVEVTQMSLYLRVLENENADTLNPQMTLALKEVYLPSLTDNIKCGNSLIGTDFGAQGEMFDDSARMKINAFDWEIEFPKIMGNGGFDCVIGNPPYVGFHGFEESKEYLKNTFVTAKGKFDLYVPFVEQGLKVLRRSGKLSFICPVNFVKREHGEGLRSYLRTRTEIVEICDFEDVQIFEGATNYTGVFIVQKNLPSKDHAFRYKRRSLEDGGFDIVQASLQDSIWVFRDARSASIVEKIEHSPNKRLEEIAEGISEGIVTGCNDVFLLDNQRIKFLRLERDTVRSCLRGSEVRRYFVEPVKQSVIYPYRLTLDRTKCYEEKELKRFKHLWNYLTSQKNNLSGREYIERSSKAWYELWNQRDVRKLACQKIVVAELADSGRFAYVDESLFYGDTVCGIVLKDANLRNYKFVLSLLNSSLINFYFKKTTVPKANSFYIFKTMFLKKLPIRTIDFHNPIEKKMHDDLVALVDKMLDLHKQLVKASFDSEKEPIERQIKAMDKKIDLLVYQLYGLTEEEIKVVEGEKG